MKKICFFMNTPFNLGGEQRIVTVLANYLVNNGFDITFLLTNINHIINRGIYNMDKKIHIIFVNDINKTKLRVKRKILSKISLLNSYTGVLKKNLEILKSFYCINEEYDIFGKIFSENEFDYVIGIGHFYSGKLALLKEKLKFKAKIIAWEHNCFKAYFETKGLRYYNQAKFVKYILPIFDHYVIQTIDDYDKMKKMFRYKPVLINNSNTFNTYKNSKLENKRFIAAGRFSKVKNFPFLIESFEKFHHTNKDWSLYIYGQGEQYDECKKIIQKYNLTDYVFLPGKTSNIEEKYMESSVYLLSSLWEGWGMVVTEAMQCGLPIVSSDLPSSREILGDVECGIIVSDYSVDAFSQAMLEIVKDDKYKYLSKNCIERVKNFDIEVIGKKWTNILK